MPTFDRLEQAERVRDILGYVKVFWKIRVMYWQLKLLKLWIVLYNKSVIF